MRLGVVTLFPEMFDALHHGIPGRALRAELLNLNLWNPRDYTYDRHRTVDDRPYGGGPGMVMKAQPLKEALSAARMVLGDYAPVVYLSPQGQPLNQAILEELAGQPTLILVAGRYEGVDERFIEAEVDRELSIGDYVLSGGELAAMVVIDGITRLLPGALGHPASADQDSFVDGLLDHPHYTRPEIYAGQPVPEVLLSGNHEAIRRWRLTQALHRTRQRRPDLLANLALTDEQRALLDGS
ncbi:tRNA m(1)G37 methyltransferase [Gammaproteobacteria bacterium]